MNDLSSDARRAAVAAQPPADPGQVPVIPLPNEGEGGPVYPGGEEQLPAVPLPGPGAGAPVYPGRPSYVLPNALVRFLNASHGYAPFRISIGGTRVVSLLPSGSSSCYSRIAAGRRRISVMGADGYVYIRKDVSLLPGMAYMIAVVNRAGGLDLAVVSDECSG